MATSRNTITARERAYRERRQLIELMGGSCTACGDDEDASGFSMEFDHPNGRDWTPRRKNRWVRMALYRRDWLAGNLRLLCRRCNARDGARRRGGRKTSV